MGKYVRRILSKLRQEGLGPTLESIFSFMKGIFAGLLFVTLDQLYDAEKSKVCTTVRGDVPESDSLALIQQLKERDEITHFCIGIRSESIPPQVEKQATTIDGIEVEFVTLHTLRFVWHMLGARVVFQKQDGELKSYRLIESDDRTFLRLYHGPITKAYGQTSASAVEKNESFIDVGRSTPPIKRSVGSDPELHFRAASEGLHPLRFEKYGYPRFDRLADFNSSEVEPLLSDSTASVMESTGDCTRILYATTHKDGVYDTTFFPFPSFDLEELRSHLRQHDIRLFIRPHPANEGRHEKFVDGEVIFSADQSFANSATEVMPFFDAIVTDYSSIYIEFLPFDRPIIFVQDDHERFREIRGFAFDYETYFPGPKIEEFDRFLDQLSAVAETGADGFARERQFVRETFVPSQEGTFADRVLEDID